MRERDPGFLPTLLQGDQRCQGVGPKLLLAPSSSTGPSVQARTSEHARFSAAAVNEPPDEPA